LTDSLLLLALADSLYKYPFYAPSLCSPPCVSTMSLPLCRFLLRCCRREREAQELTSSVAVGAAGVEDGLVGGDLTLRGTFQTRYLIMYPSWSLPLRAAAADAVVPVFAVLDTIFVFSLRLLSAALLRRAAAAHRRRLRRKSHGEESRRTSPAAGKLYCFNRSEALACRSCTHPSWCFPNQGTLFRCQCSRVVALFRLLVWCDTSQQTYVRWQPLRLGRRIRVPSAASVVFLSNPY